MNVGYSDISCGVHQLWGFEECEDRTNIEKLTDEVSFAMWEHAYDSRQYERGSKRPVRLGAAMYVFSDVVDANGDRWGRWLMEQFPDFVTRTEARNPNSGNRIALFTWLPDVKTMAKNPAWTRGKSAARKEVWNNKFNRVLTGQY